MNTEHEFIKSKLRKHPDRHHLIADSLVYLQPDSGASDEKAEGVVVGVVSTIMAQNTSFDTAIQILAANLTPPFRTHCLPDAWREDILRAYRKLTD